MTKALRKPLARRRPRRLKTLEGRRVPVAQPSIMEPGDYGFRAGTTNEWWICLPNGALFRPDDRWQLTEYDDGTISVAPSINDPGGDERDAWHGWLVRGVFTGA